MLVKGVPDVSETSLFTTFRRAHKEDKHISFAFPQLSQTHFDLLGHPRPIQICSHRHDIGCNKKNTKSEKNDKKYRNIRGT